MVVKLERKFDPIKLSNRISQLETENAKLRFRNNSLEDENNELRANVNQLNISKTTFVIRDFSFVEFCNYMKNYNGGSVSGVAVFKLNNQVYLASSYNILMYAYTLLLNDATLAEWRLYDSNLNISIYLYNSFKFDSERGQKSYLAKYFNQNGYVVVR